MLSKALEIDMFPQGLRLWGKWKDASLGPLREGMIYFYLGEFERYLKKKRPCMQAALSIGPCWGSWRGSVTGSFERRRECTSGFLFRGPRGH
jgi:hypothetical protein